MLMQIADIVREPETLRDPPRHMLQAVSVIMSSGVQNAHVTIAETAGGLCRTGHHHSNLKPGTQGTAVN